MYNETLLRNDLKVNFNNPYQQCTVGVMDTIADPNITFDDNGASNYYAQYLEDANRINFSEDERNILLEKMILDIKKSGIGKPYDCITGVSGGVDSTYLALKAKEFGLRPLIVHFDNGWNSELATQNIENIISKLDFKLFTLVVDWNEFKDIQLSYFKASVVDIEAITDHAIIATLYKLAIDYDIKYVLSGSNIVTEAVLPKYWIYNKLDHKNLIDIHSKFGTIPLKTYPLFSTSLKKKVQMKGIKTLAPLNFMPYNKKTVKEIIIRDLDWRDYGGKHYESIFTRFYQGYILPNKFHIDKRKAHLSNMIFSKQMTRKEALIELSEPIYSESQFKSDYPFVLKKLGFTENEFELYMKTPRREHTEFKVEKPFFEDYPILSPFRPLVKLISKMLPD